MATEIDGLGAWKPKDKGGIDDKELWNLDMTFSEFILPRLKEFKNMKRAGYPEIEGIDPNNEQKTVEAWEGILDDIIKGFEAHIRYATNSFLEGTENENAEVIKRKEDEHKMAIEKGFELFGRHYMNLWD